MYCPNCGVQNAKDAETCTNCHKPLPKLDQWGEPESKPGPVSPDAPPAPERPQPRPYYPGVPGSEYSYTPYFQSAPAAYYAPGYAPAPDYGIPADRVDRVGVAQGEANVWARLGAYIVDQFITQFISFVIVGIPAIIWIINFMSHHWQEFSNACDTSSPTYTRTACDETAQRILIDQGELWGGLFLVIGFGVLAIIATLAYYVILTARGATIGKRVFGLKVVRSDGTPPGFGTALLRQTVGYFVSGLFFGLGFIWIAFDQHRQGWHDKIAQTYVVRA